MGHLAAGKHQQRSAISYPPNGFSQRLNIPPGGALALVPRFLVFPARLVALGDLAADHPFPDPHLGCVDGGAVRQRENVFRLDRLAERGRALGFGFVAAGPLVRTSYRAAEAYVQRLAAEC